LNPTRLRRSALALLALAAGCGRDAAPPAGGGRLAREAIRFPVEVAPVEARAVEYSIRAVGSVEAFEQVAVTARVAGVVERVRFQEGDAIGTETVLAEIEPERHRLSAEASRAALAKAEATEAEAVAGLERRQSVNQRNPDLVRAEEVDQWRTRLAAARAEVAQARAAADLAELNLRDAFVRAPAAGIVQTRDIETGRYVQPGTVLATLVRRDPLLLRFRVPESEAAPLGPGQEVRFRLRGEHGDDSHRARISLVGAAADPRDRMVDVTARVDAPGRGELRPGAFAEIEIPVGAPRPSPVIPQTAIRPTDRGLLAFVVEDEVARERVLELGLRTADGRVEVRSGLAPGETLVVRGAEALRDGAKVAVEGAPAAVPAAKATP
jgi:multidrug efflux system membrane fusion protein